MSDCYVGVTACGCWVSAIVLHGDPEWTIEVASFVRAERRAGRSILTVTTEQVREKLARCTHKKKRAPKQKPAEQTTLPRA